MEDIIHRIELIMKKLGYNKYSQFADAVNINRSNFSQIMKGNRVIGDGVMNKICVHLNISKHWLITGKGAMFVEEKTYPQVVGEPQSTTHGKSNYEEKFFELLDEIVRLNNEIRTLNNEIRELRKENDRLNGSSTVDSA